MPPRGYALLIATILGWGLAWPMIKIGLNEIPPWTYRGVMLPAAGFVMFAVACGMREPIVLPRGQWPALLASTFLNITCWTLFSTLGLRLLGSGHASIIAYTMPLWAVTFSILFIGERPTPRRIAGLVCGLAGIGVLLSDQMGVISQSPLGALFMLIAAISWGAGTVVHKRTLWRFSPVVLTGWMILMGGLPIFAVAVVIESVDLGEISLAAIAASLFVLFIPTVFCWFAWFRVVTMAPIIVSSVAIMMVPIVAVISGGLILAEPIGWHEIGALALVISGIALVLIPPRRVEHA